jgi:HK97 family phage portal protein
MGIRDLFKRKSRTSTSIFDTLNLLDINQNQYFSTSSNTNIEDSDVVRICIDRIASHVSKLKPRHIKNTIDSEIINQTSDISKLLLNSPNPYMTTSEFLYKITSLLFLNNNSFIYPQYKNSVLVGLYPIKPQSITIKEDLSTELFLEIIMDDGKTFTLPYSSIIHLKRFYTKNDIFGGSGSNAEHKALLKTIAINDSILAGVDNAVKSSTQIKGLLKMNAMLSDKDKQKQKDIFDEALKTNFEKKGSSIIPVDNKADYVPLNIDPKLVDENTLNFIQKKILSYFGVSENIFLNKYSEDDFNAFYETTIEPLSIMLSEAFTKCLLTKNSVESGEEIIFYAERLNYASWNTKVSAIEKLMGLGILSLNESRAILGFEPVEGGNKRLQSLNYINNKLADKYQIGKEKEENE